MANKVNWLKINGVKMPTPSGFTYVEADFDTEDSVRSNTGILSRNRVRRGVLSPEYTWNAITTAQLNTILAAIEPVAVQVIAFDPKNTNADTTPYQKEFTAYAAATRKASVVLPRDDPMDTLWKISIAFIEY